VANQIFNKGDESTYTSNTAIQVPALYVDLFYDLVHDIHNFNDGSQNEGVLQMTVTNQVAITNENGVTATVFVSSLRRILVLSLFCKQYFADFLSVDRLERQIRFCLQFVRVGTTVMREWDVR
jgi:hypothetical protein